MLKTIFFALLIFCTPGLTYGEYCAFCDPKVIEAQKFYEDEEVMVLYTYKPVMPGHCLIIPKRHVERFEMVTDEESAYIFSAIKKVDQAVVKVFGTSSYLLLQKNGHECGQTVPHVHFHYIPRKTGDASEIKFIFKMWIANAKNPMDPHELKEVVEKMREAV